MKKNKMSLLSTILTSVCIVVSLETITTTATIGNSQFFWWILLLLTFFLPYCLISGELGSTYPSESGMYDWVKRAFGKKMALRVSWFYWINFPIWAASLAILFSDTVEIIVGGTVDKSILLIFQLVYCFIIAFMSRFRPKKEEIFFNLATVFKGILLVGIGIIGVFSAIKFGTATTYEAVSFIPSFDPASLSLLSVLIFNFMGFEIVTTMVKDMENPKKQLPMTILIGGIVVMLFYLLPIFGISVAIPVEALSSSTGLFDAFRILFAQFGITGIVQDSIIVIFALMFMYILVMTIASWSFGVSSVVRKASLRDRRLRMLTELNKDKVPVRISILNAVIAAVICIVFNFIPSGGSLFLTCFTICLMAYLATYISLFPTFLKLRTLDPDIERPYKVPGNNVVLLIITIAPFCILSLAMVTGLFPEFSIEGIKSNLPIIIGFGLCVVLGEIVVFFKMKKYKKHGLLDNIKDIKEDIKNVITIEKINND